MQQRANRPGQSWYLKEQFKCQKNKFESYKTKPECPLHIFTTYLDVKKENLQKCPCYEECPSGCYAENCEKQSWCEKWFEENQGERKSYILIHPMGRAISWKIRKFHDFLRLIFVKTACWFFFQRQQMNIWTNNCKK